MFRYFTKYITILLLTCLSYSGTTLAGNLDSESKSDPIKNKLTLYLFLAPDCPISLKYINRIKELSSKYSDSVKFTGLVPKGYTMVELEKFKKEYDIDFDLSIDDNNQLINELNVKVTPEVVLLDVNKKVRYQGAIDNWFYALGKNRSKPTEHYLLNAIEYVLANRAIEVSKTEAIGCIISK